MEDGLDVEEAIKAETLLEVEVKVGVETKRESVGVILTCKNAALVAAATRPLAATTATGGLLRTLVLPIVFP